MAVPRVFVSSTCYDLGAIRGDLHRMISSLGFEAVLSDHAGVYYDPTREVAEAAVRDVRNCDLFVLLIGARFGSAYKDQDKSVTNAEYEAAVDARIPVFALVDASVLQDLRTYESNLGNPEVDVEKIKFAAVENTKVFRFVDQVRGAAFNNALQPFTDFPQIEQYLKFQWASLLRDFLTHASEERRVSDTLAEIRGLNQKIEAILARSNPGAADDVMERFERIEPLRQIARYLLRSGVEDLTVVKGHPTPDGLFAALGLEVSPSQSDLMMGTVFQADWERLRQLMPDDLVLLTKLEQTEAHRVSTLTRLGRARRPPANPEPTKP